MFVDQQIAYRKAYLVRLLDRLCAELEITDARRKEAEQRYAGVAEWLSSGEHYLLHGLSIYLQGSTALGTTVRPIRSLEHDVDLVAFLPSGSRDLPPSYVKKVVGDRLKASGHYIKLLQEKQRCWRLVYANEFHLDIAPAVLDTACWRGGELVPDKSLRVWKETNPKGYRTAFEVRAALVPVLRVTKAFDEVEKMRADIEPFPVASRTRSLLCRIVQIAKRHRDVHFETLDPALSPISVIVTTVLAWSYEACVRATQYDTEFDVLLAVLRRMPEFIGQTLPDGSPGYYIPNETTHGENFAERWNDDPRRAGAFFAWHRKAVADLEALAFQEGSDRVRSLMDEVFGSWPVARAFTALDEEVARARGSGLLRVAPLVGVTTTTAFASTPVRSNTFYGRHVR